MNKLCIIPARGGSKGVPNKNIKELNGIPLLYYTIAIARKFFQDSDICLTTDSDAIVQAGREVNLNVHFKRPDILATDFVGSREVMLHALDFYNEKLGKVYDVIVLLQPTSPFRKAEDIYKMIQLLDNRTEMVVSVLKSHCNPYFSLFEENERGFLIKCKKGNFTRRQDTPDVYTYNGSIYVIKAESLKAKPIYQFKYVKKFEMDQLYSVDIDTKIDWLLAEAIINNGLYIYEDN